MPKVFTTGINFRKLRVKMQKIKIPCLYLCICLFSSAHASPKDTCNADNIGFSFNSSFNEDLFDKKEMKRNISVEDNNFAWVFSFSELSQDNTLRNSNGTEKSHEEIIYTNFSEFLEDELFLTIESENLVKGKYKEVKTRFENKNRIIFFIKLNKYRNNEYLTKLIITAKNNLPLSESDYKKVDNFFDFCILI